MIDTSSIEYNIYLLKQKLDDLEITETLVRYEIEQLEKKIENTQQSINTLNEFKAHFGINVTNESIFNKIRRFFENDDVQKVHVIAMTETSNTRVKEIMSSFFVSVNSLINEKVHELYVIIQHDTELMHSFQVTTSQNTMTYAYLHLYRFTNLIKPLNDTDVIRVLEKSLQECIHQFNSLKHTVLHLYNKVFEELNPVQVLIHERCDTEKRNPRYRFKTHNTNKENNSSKVLFENLQIEYYNCVSRIGCYDVTIHENSVLFHNNENSEISNTSIKKTYYSRLKAVRYDLKKAHIQIERRFFMNGFTRMFKQEQNEYIPILLSALLNKGTLLWIQVGHYDSDIITDLNCRFTRFMKTLKNTYT